MPPFTHFARGDTPTEAERRLIEAVSTGTIADCTDLSEAEKTVDARLIAALATGRFVDADGETIATQEFGLRLESATVPNRLNLENATVPHFFGLLDCTLEAAFDFDRARFGTDLFLRWSKLHGECRLAAAKIAGQFSADDATFANDGARAIMAQDVRAAGWFMHRVTVIGAFHINSATLNGPFSALSAIFDNGNGLAMRASHARFKDGLFLHGKAKCTGAILLDRTTINVGLDLRGLKVTSCNVRGAINLTGATVDGDTLLDKSTTIDGKEFAGARLLGAFVARRTRFNGRLSFRDATLTAASVAHRDGLSEDKPGETPEAPSFEDRHMAVILTEARIDGRLVMPDDRTKVRGVVDLSRTRCDTLEDFSAGWPAPWPAPREWRAKLCRERMCIKEAGRTVDVQHLDLDGFEFAHLANPAGVDGRRDPDARAPDGIAGARIRWLEAQSRRALVTDFNPQPWRQTAKVLREMGYDEEAREISIRRRVRQRFAENTPKARALVSWLLHFTSDYGFNPWKAVGWSLGLIFVCYVIYGVAANQCALPGCRDGSVFSPIAIAERDPAILTPALLPDPSGDRAANDVGEVKDVGVAPRAVVSENYPPFQPLLFSLDTFLPLLPLGIEEDWAPNAEYTATVTINDRVSEEVGTTVQMPWGRILTSVMVVQELLGAILLAIAISGFTGLLTRDER